MQRTTIRSLYADAAALGGQAVALCGWVRTLRDSKAFGFIELNDGSCFKNCQIVFEREALSNYDEIARQNVGASLVVEGTLVLTPENRQPFEVKAQRIAVMGTSSPDYPLQKEAAFDGISARDRLSAPAHQHLRRGVPHPQRGGVRHPQILQRARLRVCAHPHHHGQRLRGRRRDVPGDHPRPGQDQGRGRL